MRRFKILISLIFLTSSLFCEPQVTISLITDQGVKKAESLRFSISNTSSPLYEFTFDKFSGNGKYSNPNLFQYNKRIGTGQYKIAIEFKTDKAQNIEDSLFIDITTSRVEIFIFISTNDSTGDYIKEVNTIRYKSSSNFVKFSKRKKRKIGSKGTFKIKNVGDKEIYGYPNSAFFFGTLYEEIGSNSWSQHYPRYINIKYCDTVALPRPLAVRQSTKAWTPNDKDCSEYSFAKKGKYYFELLYSTTNTTTQLIQGQTIHNKVDVYRQIFEFKVR